MTIDPIQFVLPPVDTPLFKTGIKYDENTANASGGFQDVLTNALSNLKDVSNKASVAMQDYAAGGETDISQVMLTLEKSQVATQLAVQVRNKLVEGFNELVRMQM